MEDLFKGYGYTPYFVEGSDRETMHQAVAATLEHCLNEIRSIQDDARRTGIAKRPRWPMIVLRTPKGWTAPAEIDGRKVEGSWRSHQVPMADVSKNPAHLKVLETWLRSYKAEELFDANGTLISELKELAPRGTRRMSANPHGNGGLMRKPLRMPDFRKYCVEVTKPGTTEVENTKPLGMLLRDVMRDNMTNFLANALDNGFSGASRWRMRWRSTSILDQFSFS